MTAPEPSSEAAPAARKRSPGVVAAIVIVVVLALVGGALRRLQAHEEQGRADAGRSRSPRRSWPRSRPATTRQLRSLSTGEGTTQLLALKPDDVDGVTITAASCKVFGATTPTRVCTATRPGGQLQLRLVFAADAWKVDLANVGPVGLPPTSSTTATT